MIQMKCVAISDTHGMYDKIDIPDGDVLIHAGDIFGQGKLREVAAFNAFLGALPHRVKIVIAGNHDWCFAREEEACRVLLTNAVYLQDEAVTIDGVKFYGAPWQPFFHNWAFNLQRGRELKAKWDLIDADTDVLITHGPAFGVHDQTVGGLSVGCEELAHAITRIRPRFHVCGHIHESYGVVEKGGCTYINASIANHRFQPENAPVVFEV
ncbi:metallophosphatase domain-containing protein [Hahella sp. HN01]|uniref:metallophosphatase domain-containing protein n=1 Tax=Hahella sp. HN01 TaxID=2847262 RepID=UPI0020A63774|nr:metallophosphatase domain-containing protein [Hahella sp. HN01]